MDHGTLIEAVRARHGNAIVLLGPSAAWAHGCRVADPDTAVHVAVTPTAGIRRRGLVIPHRHRLATSDICTTALGPATTPLRTALDVARGIGTADMTDDDRVAWIDAVIARTTLTAAEVHAEADSCRDLAGLRRGRSVLREARDGAESIPETRLRLLVVRAGFCEPVVQHVVRDGSGCFVARLDLAWPARCVGLEYDGAHHRGFVQHGDDMARHNRLRALGWQVIQVDARQLRCPGPVLGHLTSLLGAP